MQSCFARGSFCSIFLLLALGLHLSPKDACADILDFHTHNHSLGSLSSVTLSINIIGLQTVSIPDISLQGWGLADLDLDASNSGTIDLSDPLGLQLYFQNKSVNFSGIFFVGSIQITDIAGELQFGPEGVANRSFHIDASSTGALVLNEGKLKTVITGGALYNTITNAAGSNVIELDLSVQPLVFDFANLGSLVMSGTTDDDVAVGLHPNGPEINLPLRGVSTIPWPGVVGFPSEFGVSGNLYVATALPEFHTLGLTSLAVAGIGAYAACRRRIR